MKILKRNGEPQEFDANKIISAVTKANDTVDDSSKLTKAKIKAIAKFVKAELEETPNTLSVEDIQDIVEVQLMSNGAFEVAKNYITYRFLHKLARDKYNDLMAKIKDKFEAAHVDNQNANMDEASFSGRMGEAASLLSREYALDYLLSPMAKNNHVNNMIYIHDLDHYAIGDHNCMSIPFDALLSEGFCTRQTDVRPAQSVSTAFQLTAVIFQLQSLQQFGGVSATHLDWTMVPYVRKSFWAHYKEAVSLLRSIPVVGTLLWADVEQGLGKDKLYPITYKRFLGYSKVAYDFAMRMTKKELDQAAEGMYHNLNTLQSRSGGQLPFTSINFGTCTLPEGRMVSRSLLEASIKGIGKQHRTSIFPCVIFQSAKGINRAKGEPNYDLFRLALKCTSLRLYPNYANVNWSGNAGYDEKDPKTYFSTMGCRTANGLDINGLQQQKDGRGNICPVTIILPTLAMEANKEVEPFMQLLDAKIHEAKDMLIERFNWIASQPASAAKFMYENNIMAGYKPEEGIISALKHGTIVIGQLGLAEALRLLIGVDHTEEKGMELAKRIEQLFKDRCAEFKKQYKLNFGVYYTPAENLCFTALKKFRAKYGVIENVSDKDFFTNSMHVPVWYKMSAFDKIDIEAQLTGYSSAGCITYVELESACKYNIDALEALVLYAMDKDIPYFAINVPNDQCQSCGYLGEIPDECPECGGSAIKRLRRVTGYLTGDYKTAFNEGKQSEVSYRAKHVGEE